MSFSKTVTVSATQSGFWGLTAFFNPQRYSRRLRAYRSFRENTRKQGLRLLTVELAFSNAAFELRRRDAEILIQIPAGDDSVMWQKERLLNIGLSHLPPECNAFAWLDCDVIFDNPDWVAQTAKLLNRYAIVQPFAVCVRLPRGQTTVEVRDANAPRFERGPSAACAYARRDPLVDYMLGGHTGLAWAARRSLFDDIGFYDRMVVGGGDSVLACGFFGRPSHRFTHLLPEPLVADQRKWIAAMADRVAGSVGFTNGGLLHLWHGYPRRRMTAARLRMLVQYSFEPANDLRQNPDGVYVWAGNKPALRRAVARYFWIRNEDGYRHREIAFRALDAAGELQRGFTKRVLLCSAKAKVAVQSALPFLLGPPGTQKLTLILVNWKRPQGVERIVAAYSGYAVIEDIVVWNNNPESTLDTVKHPDVKIVTCKYDAGLDSRWAAAALADGQHLLIHDDDLMVSERSLGFLFSRYLRQPALIHGIRGRQLNRSGIFEDGFGPVDVVSSSCMIVNHRCIPEYFRRIALFDDLRNHCRGAGEDIVMSYVVRSMTGEKNMAYPTPLGKADDDPAVSIDSLRRRSRLEFVGGAGFPSESARNEIARRCIEQLTGDNAPVRIEDYGMTQLSRLFPAAWPRYFQAAEEISKEENFTLSENLSRDKFTRALSLLCRRAVSWSQSGGMPAPDRFGKLPETESFEELA